MVFITLGEVINSKHIGHRFLVYKKVIDMT